MNLEVEYLIVIIEDDRSFVEEVRKELSHLGKVVHMQRADYAASVIRSMAPDLIVVDLNLPRGLSLMDEEEGVALIRHLSVDERRHVIVATGAVSSSAEAQLAGLSIADVYLKSEPIALLREMAERKLGRTRGDPPHRGVQRR